MLKPCTTELSDCRGDSVCTQCADEFWYTDPVDDEDDDDDDNNDDDDDPTFDDASNWSCVEANDAICTRYGSSATCTSNSKYGVFIGEDLSPIHAQACCFALSADDAYAECTTTL